MSSKIECTAVNALIDLVQKKPMDRDSAAELLFAPPGGRKRPANGLPSALFADELPSLVPASVAPAPAPIAAQRRSDPGSRHAAAVAKAAQPRTFAVEVAVEPTEMRARSTKGPKISIRTPPFEATPPKALAAFEPVTGREPRQAVPAVHEDLETTYIPRAAAADLPSLLKKLAVPAGLLLMVGIGVGAAISMTRHKEEGKSFDHIAATTLPTFQPALPTVMLPPRVAAPPVPVKAKLVAVRIESSPAGASATLLDRDTGKSMPLGSTPLEASLDPVGSYDVRFELDGRSTQTEHLTFAANDASPRLAIAFAAPAPTPAPTSKKHHRHHDAVKKAAAKRVASAPRTTKAAASSSGEAALASLGPAKTKTIDAPGAISVSASVPCSILLDGVNTGMSTPAKLTAAAGHHSVRLIAATQHINKQFGVDVTAKKMTRLDQTF